MPETRSPKPFTPRQAAVGRRLMRPLAAVNTWVYRMSNGRIGARFPRGAPILLLTTTGRHSGKPRTVPLLYLADGDRFVVVASQGGMPSHPDWYHNLTAEPEVTAQVGPDRHELRARVAPVDEKAELWRKLTAMYADYDSYQARTSREIPVVVLEPRA